MGREDATLRRIAIIGGGISGLAAAWGLHHHPDRFDFRLFEARDRIGGNAITADMPQDDGSSIPFDISVAACIPSVYDHIVLLMKQFGIELVDTRFSYSVKYRKVCRPADSGLPRGRILDIGPHRLADRGICQLSRRHDGGVRQNAYWQGNLQQRDS